MLDVGENIFRAVMVGLVNGTIYGLIGLGIVLIFKTQRVINFAQAEIATFAGFAMLIAHSGLGIPYVGAAVIAVSAAVLLTILIERIVIRPLRDAPAVTVFVATAGISLLLIALTVLIGGANPFRVEALFGATERELLARPILGLVSPQRLIVLGSLIVLGGALALLFRRTTLGKALSALSVEPFAVRLAGISTQRMGMLVWGVAGLLAGIAGVAYTPTVTLVPGLFTTFALIPALTAVVVGGLTSLPGALLGGLLIGVFAELVVLASSTYAPALPGADTIATFTILLLTLMFRPQGLLASES